MATLLQQHPGRNCAGEFRVTNLEMIKVIFTSENSGTSLDYLPLNWSECWKLRACRCHFHLIVGPLNLKTHQTHHYSLYHCNGLHTAVSPSLEANLRAYADEIGITHDACQEPPTLTKKSIPIHRYPRSPFMFKPNVEISKHVRPWRCSHRVEKSKWHSFRFDLL